MKNSIFRDIKNPVRTSQGAHYVSATQPSQLMLRKIWGFHGGDYEECSILGYDRVVLVKTDVSQERITSIIRVTRIGELGTTLAVTSNRSTLRRNSMYSIWKLLLTLLLARRLLSPWWWKRYVTPKRWFIQELHGVTSQTTPFFKLVLI
jgi:hypothetical protein